MKVYVSKLPKDCIECPFCQDIKVNAGMDRLLFCKANKGKAIKNIEKSFDKCIVKNEFQSLTDYTKQVRKEVCNDFKSRFLVTCQIEKGCDTASFSLEVLNRILDQLQEDKQ